MRSAIAEIMADRDHELSFSRSSSGDAYCSLLLASQWTAKTTATRFSRPCSGTALSAWCYNMTEFRTEYDSLGEVRLPSKAYYGAQTQRAVENFPISGQTMPKELIHAFGLVKWAAAAPTATWANSPARARIP